MKKRIVSILLILVALTVVFSMVAYASVDEGKFAPGEQTAPPPDDRMDPLTAQQRAMRDTAMEAVAYGKAFEIGRAS